MAFADASFDAVICNHVLEHVPDDVAAMAEVFRVLAPGGWAMLQVPFAVKLARTYEDPTIRSPEARREAFGQRDHVRIYGRDYTERLESVGFRVETFRWTEHAASFGGPRNLYGLNPEEQVFVARKPGRQA